MSVQINGINVIDDDRNFSAAGIVTVGTGNSATIIDGTTGITSVGIGITMEGVPGNISIAGTITAAGVNFPLDVVAFIPSDGATNIQINENINIVFNQSVEKATSGIGLTANITLRENSSNGTVIQTISIASTAIVVSGTVVTIDPPSPLPFETNIYVVVDASAFNSPGGDSQLINTYNFTTAPPYLGAAWEGGYLICQSGGTQWIVAPSSSEVSRNWDARDDAVTRAQQVSGCTGWFVPDIGQLQNPGYTCRTYWDSYCNTWYWSSSRTFSPAAWNLNFLTGVSDQYGAKSAPYCVRAFRCVSY